LKELQSIEVSPQPNRKTIQQKASDTKKKRAGKWFILEHPNHPTFHILKEQLGARLRLHLLSHCPYPTKLV